jgi:hypothetical protein
MSKMKGLKGKVSIVEIAEGAPAIPAVDASSMVWRGREIENCGRRRE